MISFEGDDPYYCGMRARVPNFSKHQQQQRGQRGASSSNADGGNSSSGYYTGGGGSRYRGGSSSSGSKTPMPSRSVPNLQQLAAQLPAGGAAHPFWWHSRMYPEPAGMGGGSK